MQFPQGSHVSMLLDMSKTGLAPDVGDANPAGLSCKSPRQELMPNKCHVVLLVVPSIVPAQCLSGPFSFD